MRAEQLEGKYRELLDLRVRASSAPDRARLRALAAQFPGALRELDELPRHEIERRIDELAHRRWRPELCAIARFHELVLELRAETRTSPSKGRRPSRLALARLAEERGVTLERAHQLVFPFAHVRRLPAG